MLLDPAAYRMLREGKSHSAGEHRLRPDKQRRSPGGGQLGYRFILICTISREPERRCCWLERLHGPCAVSHRLEGE